ncbi:MAG: enolase C-terminal domain-like protein [Thiogranum sp.]|nr:enolase C-terminal domain-like protein [Thiogranum sp.]
MQVRKEHARIEQVAASAYTIPTDAPESDGTLAWDATTLVLVEITAGGHTGIGFSYTDASAAWLVRDTLAAHIRGRDAMDIPACWWAMLDAVRNLGRPGISATAIAAVDIALWDLKARLLELPLVKLLGAVRERVPAYGSGGFTSYSPAQLEAQLGGWAEQGFERVKMKIARYPEQDEERLRRARATIGPDVELFVDANGGYDRKQALGWMPLLRELGVTWLEEPVSSDDLEGLRLLRDRGPGHLHITAGEYGYHPGYFRQMLEAGAVDIMQADVTRCAGITGLLEVAALCTAFQIPLSTHTAPAIHAHLGCAIRPVRHIEWFHDHVRIEHMLFDGTLEAVDGQVKPDLSRAGLGLIFRRNEAVQYAR